MNDPLPTDHLEALRTIIAQERSRQPVVHLHVNVPADVAADADRLAQVISRVFKEINPLILAKARRRKLFFANFFRLKYCH